MFKFVAGAVTAVIAFVAFPEQIIKGVKRASDWLDAQREETK
jgi:hypothetical protein